MKNKFLQISIGISMMLISASMLVYSITPAKATTTTTKFLDGDRQTGRYMFAYGVSDGDYTLIMYDTQTANSISFSYKKDRRIWTQDPISEQLPKYPFQQ